MLDFRVIPVDQFAVRCFVKMNVDEEIRAAAEAILTSSTSSRQPTSQNQHSFNSQAGRYAAEDLVVGMRRSGQMSVVRRFFCLFVTFDLLFTCLLWLIIILLNGDDIASALSKQIVHYNIHTSLFDVVMAASCRFTVLLLFYALLYICHWWVIAGFCTVCEVNFPQRLPKCHREIHLAHCAKTLKPKVNVAFLFAVDRYKLTTAGTCAFLIAKVFVYSWTAATQPVFQVLLVLISFVLSWGEAWFLDFRVLPQELQAMEYLQVTSMYSEAERAPLLRNYLQRLQRVDDYTESVGSYYSPVDSPERTLGCSDDEDARKSGVGRRDLSQDMKYRQEGQDVLDVSWRILNSPDWKLEKETADGDKVYSKKMPGVGKVLKLTGTVGFPAEQLLHELFSKAENIPNWNPTILETRTVQSEATGYSKMVVTNYRWTQHHIPENLVSVNGAVKPSNHMVYCSDEDACSCRLGNDIMYSGWWQLPATWQHHNRLSDSNVCICLVIDAHTDISYQVVKDAGGGVVSSRDFVVLRHWGMKDNCYVSAGISIKHPKVPPNKRYIRGENGPTCWVMRPILGDEDQCAFQWLLNVNLKGWLPNSVVQSALTTSMLDFIKYLRHYTEKLKQEGQ